MNIYVVVEMSARLDLVPNVQGRPRECSSRIDSGWLGFKHRLPNAILPQRVVAVSLSVPTQKSRSGEGFFDSIPSKFKSVLSGVEGS